MKVKEVIVVEGKADTVKIQQAVQADTIETNGSAINKEVIQRIKHAKEKRGIIIFTDPDYPGERIRHIIDQEVPGCKHAFLTKDEAKSKRSNHKSLGIEHASVQTIQEALRAVYVPMESSVNEITKEDLINYRLIGGSGARIRRKRLGELLRIGQTNGKQLYKRLKMFQITKKEFEKTMKKVLEEDQ